MKSQIIKLNSLSEFYIDEGCHITESLSEPGEAGISVARARVEVGEKTELHRLKDVVERYLVVEGEGLVEIEGLEPEVITAGDMVVIPAGKTQRIKNSGKCDLVFLCICSPAFTPECYEALPD